ncbi:MAG: hypothetical protein LBK82_11520 [Planctomycetaceae bacterium]|jgi:uncharacterized Zn finger protein (UPF0148 family)|nr:hypothetical protein [Planctomycetaceae bacterium]
MSQNHTCPNCGAVLVVSGSQTNVVCESCGGTVTIHDSYTQVELAKLQAQQKRLDWNILVEKKKTFTVELEKHKANIRDLKDEGLANDTVLRNEIAEEKTKSLTNGCGCGCLTMVLFAFCSPLLGNSDGSGLLVLLALLLGVIITIRCLYLAFFKKRIFQNKNNTATKIAEEQRLCQELEVKLKELELQMNL